jgi:hypothetical protein
MFVHLWTRVVAWRLRGLRQPLKLLTLGLLAACAQGCATQPTMPYAGASPADPNASVRAVRYRPTVGQYRSERPVEPASWREQNDRVAPAPKP